VFHTVLDLLDPSYQRIRQFLPRKRFFNDLRALTCYLCFDRWEALIDLHDPQAQTGRSGYPLMGPFPPEDLNASLPVGLLSFVETADTGALWSPPPCLPTTIPIRDHPLALPLQR
jgi:hypothetical protein